MRSWAGVRGNHNDDDDDGPVIRSSRHFLFVVLPAEMSIPAWQCPARPGAVRHNHESTPISTNPIDCKETGTQSNLAILLHHNMIGHSERPGIPPWPANEIFMSSSFNKRLGSSSLQATSVCRKRSCPKWAPRKPFRFPLLISILRGNIRSQISTPRRTILTDHY